jgi:hypothetical protein
VCVCVCVCVCACVRVCVCACVIGILDLVQTDETYVLSELSVRAKDAKKADFAKMGG